MIWRGTKAAMYTHTFGLAFEIVLDVFDAGYSSGRRVVFVFGHSYAFHARPWRIRKGRLGFLIIRGGRLYASRCDDAQKPGVVSNGNEKEFVLLWTFCFVMCVYLVK